MADIDPTRTIAPGRPLSILIAALGGEGGGVLADWIVTAARSLALPVRASSIPGVAQRTGATTYYVEIGREASAAAPLMTLAPVAGLVDVVLASEMLEASRVLLSGFVSPATTLIASTHRVYTVAEKMEMGDGRIDEARLQSAARELAGRALLADLRAVAEEAGAMLNSVLFGALIGSGATPLTREACEQAIRLGGKGVEPSLRGFARGFDAARAGAPGRRSAQPPLPPEAAQIVELGAAKVRDFQDARYEQLYRDRVEAVRRVDHEPYDLTRETARFLALWMAYDDVIRVADLKSRRSRIERVRAEVRAAPGVPVHVVDYFKPRPEEIAAILPPVLAAPLEKRARRPDSGFALHVRTTSFSGFIMLRTLAWLRPLRRMSSRYAAEQALIDRWLAAIRASATSDAPLALEIARCGRLIKGYGDTHERGRGSFLRILEALVEAPGVTAERVRQAREAALAEPEGRTLENTLAAQGVTPRPPQAKPLRFIPRPTEKRESA